MEPEIIFEDNHLLVAVKPPGYLAQADGRPGERPDLLNWGKNYLKIKYNKPGAAYLGLVHRLDLGAGGLMTLAKTSKAAARLSEQFRHRTLDKIYLALAETGAGTPKLPGNAGRLEHRLVRDGRITRLAEASGLGVPACLDWRVIQSVNNFTLFAVRLITGFKHQIRAQLAWGLKRPLVGDYLYGAAKRPGYYPAVGLWACRLGLTHPTLKTRLNFQALPPADAWPFRLLPLRAADFPPKDFDKSWGT